jgi:NAD(P)-dependent dehydrogenase (short-subunit alcohol dehydrogenase family)
MADLDPGTLFDVKGLVTVITGGGTGTSLYVPRMVYANHVVGIGLMLAQALEANGAIVYILGRRLEVLEEAAKTAVSLFNRQLYKSGVDTTHRSMATFTL